MADTVKPIRIEGAALLDYQKSKGLISKKARKPHSMTRKKRQDDMEGGFDSPSNSPPGPSIDYRQINVSRTGAASSPMTSTKIGGSDVPPKGGSVVLPNGGSDVPPKGGSVVPPKGGSVVPPKGGADTPEKKIETPQSPAKNIGTPLKQNTTPLTQPTFSSPLKGGSSPLITTPGHAPNPPSSDSPLPAIQASREAAKEGGGKVELAPKKKGTRHGIVLAPPRESKKKHVRGHTRKIRVQLSNMKRRLHTAKVIHKQSSEKPIEEVRKLLEEAKLIRSGKSSIPESLLRNMYRDYLVLRSKAL